MTAPDAAPEPPPRAGDLPEATSTRAGPAGPAVAVLVARSGRLPGGARDAVVEAGGQAIVVGDGAREGAASLTPPVRAWWYDTGVGFRPAAMAALLAPALEDIPLVVLPATPDGRDLAPRLAAVLDRPLLAGASEVAVELVGGGGSEIAVEFVGEGVGKSTSTSTSGGSPDRTGMTVRVRASLSRLDDRVLVPATAAVPVVATLVPGPRDAATVPNGGPGADIRPLPVTARPATEAAVPADPEVLAVLAADPATMALDDARRVMGGGAGLVRPGEEPGRAAAAFDLLADVASALGASAGATRVATDAGWAPTWRQIGTTGVSIDPDLYVAFGISGAIQHVGGLGSPRHVVSVNTDSSCPMTAMASLGLVTDARALLVELARRLGRPFPPALEEAHDG